MSAAAAAADVTIEFGDDGRIRPHGGGKLVDLRAPVSAAAGLKAACNHTLELTDRQACDVELLSVGAFTPLEGFMNEDAYASVLAKMRLPSGALFGLPVVLDVAHDGVKPGDKVLLTHRGQDLAVMAVESRWRPNKAAEAAACYGSTSIEHPAVQMIAMERGPFYLGGAVTGLELPRRVFPCATPAEVRASLPARTDVVAFQCRNPIHRAHYELFTRALDAPNVARDGVVLVHPTCGPTQDDDIPGIVRYHTYEVLQKEVANPRVRWAYLPYSMHMAGPREAIQHMLLRKNYGCTHFIIGRDMAGCKSSLTGEDFYGAYDAQDCAKEHAAELGMRTVPSLNVVYTAEQGYLTADVAEKEGLTVKKLSGTAFRKMLRSGEDIPEWFAFKSVVGVLREHQAAAAAAAAGGK
jgi:sulfate adenylyltransferase